MAKLIVSNLVSLMADDAGASPVLRESARLNGAILQYSCRSPA